MSKKQTKGGKFFFMLDKICPDRQLTHPDFLKLVRNTALAVFKNLANPVWIGRIRIVNAMNLTKEEAKRRRKKTYLNPDFKAL